MSDALPPVMLFAAGFGTRMRPLTADRPKPLIEVAGQPLIQHALGLAQAAQAERIVANTHYLADQMEAYLKPRNIAISREVPDILDTGGGLRAALPLLGPGPVITMNTDAIWSGPNPLCDLIRAWDPDRMDALLMCVPPAQAIGHAGGGDFAVDAAGRVRRGAGLIYGGVQILKTDRLKDVTDEAFSLNVIWDRMLADDRLFAIAYPGRWCDVGHPGGIALAEALLAGRDV